MALQNTVSGETGSSPLPRFDLLFMSGMQGSGKTVLSAGLDGPYVVTDMGPVLKAQHALEEPGASYETWIGAHESSDPLYVPRFIGAYLLSHPEIAESGRPPCVVGARSLSAIREISAIVNPACRGIVYVEAPYDLRQTRYHDRAGYQRTMPFATAEDYNTRLGTPALVLHADLVLDNTGSLTESAASLSRFALLHQTQTGG